MPPAEYISSTGGTQSVLLIVIPGISTRLGLVSLNLTEAPLRGICGGCLLGLQVWARKNCVCFRLRFEIFGKLHYALECPTVLPSHSSCRKYYRRCHYRVEYYVLSTVSVVTSAGKKKVRAVVSLSIKFPSVCRGANNNPGHIGALFGIHPRAALPCSLADAQRTSWIVVCESET